jgi:hypothetical protein
MSEFAPLRQVPPGSASKGCHSSPGLKAWGFLACLINYHLDVWQNVPNAGKVLLWLDWINGKNDERVNKLGRESLALTDFRYNDFIFNGLVGDSTLTFTNLPENFQMSLIQTSISAAFKPTPLLSGERLNFLEAKWQGSKVFSGKPMILQMRFFMGSKAISDPSRDFSWEQGLFEHRTK